MLTAAAMFVASLSASAVNVTLKADPPAVDGIYKWQDPLDITKYGYVTGSRYRNSSGELVSAGTIAQGFSTIGAQSQMSLNAVTFLIGGYGTGVLNKGFELNIYESSAMGDSPLNSTLLSTQTGALPGSLTARNYITFDLDETVIMDTNKYYTVEFVFTDFTGESPGGNAYSLRLYTVGAGVDNAIDGRRWIGTTGANGETTYTTQTTNGLVMYIDATPIPEPSTYSLLGAAAVVGYVVMRKRLKRNR